MQIERFMFVVDALPSTSKIGRLYFVNNSTTKKLYAVFATDVFTEIASAASSGTFVNQEVPTGTINGSNATFTLAHIPIDESLNVFVAGRLCIEDTDYTIAGAVLTMDQASVPGVSDTIVVSYNY